MEKQEILSEKPEKVREIGLPKCVVTLFKFETNSKMNTIVRATVEKQ